jgi:hypothetical protein
MMRFGRRIRSALPAVVLTSACIATLSVQYACILAQPSGELPRIPESRPTIVHASVVPSTSAVLTQFPSTLVVPVELADPNVEFEYVAFIDYNPLTGDGLVEEPRHSVYEVSNNSANTVGRTRTLTILLPDPPETDRCHTIEVIVALRLASDGDLTGNAKLRHTPLPPGGDSATWFYNPSGDLGGCPTLDAGIDAGADADADAGPGEGGV